MMVIIRNYQFPGHRLTAPKPAIPDGSLLADLTAFAERHDLAENRAEWVVRYAHLFDTLRAGRKTRESTIERVRAAMAAYRGKA